MWDCEYICETKTTVLPSWLAFDNGRSIFSDVSASIFCNKTGWVFVRKCDTMGFFNVFDVFLFGEVFRIFGDFICLHYFVLYAPMSSKMDVFLWFWRLLFLWDSCIFKTFTSTSNGWILAWLLTVLFNSANLNLNLLSLLYFLLTVNYNPGQNIWSKLKKSENKIKKLENGNWKLKLQEKFDIYFCVFFLTAVAKSWRLEVRLSTRERLHPNLRFS